ncbi:hypothetical protein ACIGW8_34405 [Streptomyces sioyaensis]|uniref:hypothetical protein n=1 Tax=Streptomyces sioyaensis TaxID=67364 RepID=UPI0037D7945D
MMDILDSSPDFGEPTAVAPLRTSPRGLLAIENLDSLSDGGGGTLCYCVAVAPADASAVPTAIR